ncbi:MAG: hypothetical protein QE263_00965 [Vampirovibrionales bacterium]|nr:hypothetical protein [Vampirovibrionales bacterium]
MGLLIRKCLLFVVAMGVLLLPLCWLGVGFSAPSKRTVASAQVAIPVLQPSFAYRVDAAQHLTSGLQSWAVRHQQQPIDDAGYRALVWDAFKASNDTQPLTVWRFQGEPHPAVIQPTVVLTNPSEKAWLNLTVTLTVLAQWGSLQAKPPLWLLDTDALRAKTHWQPISHTNFTVRVLAPDQSHTLNGTAISLPDVLASHLGEWPVQLGVIATVKSRTGTPAFTKSETRIQLIPNYLVPDPPSIRLP